MCRIFCSPSSVNYKRTALIDFFSKLEKRLGKDGNGLYSLKAQTLEKGVDFMPNCKELRGGFVFHTRLATHGKKKDYNCQPFEGNNYVLVHNGVFPSITPYARMLGFKRSDTKYSDSYMLHYIVEKVGIWNLYMAIKDKSYGVILIYDKKLNKIFLLKNSGSFEAGKLITSQKYIYGSSDIDFWNVEDKKSLSNGMYRLEEDGYTKMYSIETPIYNYHKNYNYNYNTYNSNKRWTQKQSSTNTKKVNACQWCSDPFTENETRYALYNYTICWSCYKESTNQDDDEEEDTGIGALFGNDPSSHKLSRIHKCEDCGRILNNVWCITKEGNTVCTDCYPNRLRDRNNVPVFCQKCSWLKNNKCEYDGIPREGFYYKENKMKCHSSYNISPKQCNGCKMLKDEICWFGEHKNREFGSAVDDKTKLFVCNSVVGQVRVPFRCNSCQEEIESADDWEIFGGSIILCLDCYNAVDIMPPIPNKCESCGSFFDPETELVKINSEIMCKECSDFTLPDDSEKIEYLGQYKDFMV